MYSTKSIYFSHCNFVIFRSDADSRAGDFDDDRTLNGSNDGFCSSNDGDYDPSDDDFYQENEDAFMDRQTCFSKMSMQSASVMRRNGGLQMVDKQFEVVCYLLLIVGL